MKNLTVYLPNVKFIVGTVIVLALLTFVLRAFAGNATMGKVKTYLGLAA
jgi:hypothetical protein